MWWWLLLACAAREPAPEPVVEPPSEQALDAMARWAVEVNREVAQEWAPPALAECELDLLAYVAADGALVRVDLVRSSGDRAVDESAVEAIREAAPLPPPPPPVLAEGDPAPVRFHLTCQRPSP